jgi:hypothetical protein
MVKSPLHRIRGRTYTNKVFDLNDQMEALWNKCISVIVVLECFVGYIIQFIMNSSKFMIDACCNIPPGLIIIT